MTSTLDVTATQDQLLDSIRQGQQLILDAVQAAAAAPTAPLPSVADRPDPAEAVAQSFDFAERLLANQREFAEKLVGVAAPSATAKAVKQKAA